MTRLRIEVTASKWKHPKVGRAHQVRCSRLAQTLRDIASAIENGRTEGSLERPDLVADRSNGPQTPHRSRAMADATLSLTIKLINGGVTRAAELSLLRRGLMLAGETITQLGGKATSGTVYGDGGGSGANASPVSVSWTYSPAATQ